MGARAEVLAEPLHFTGQRSLHGALPAPSEELTPMSPLVAGYPHVKLERSGSWLALDPGASCSNAKALAQPV